MARYMVRRLRQYLPFILLAVLLFVYISLEVTDVVDVVDIPTAEILERLKLPKPTRTKDYDPDPSTTDLVLNKLHDPQPRIDFTAYKEYPPMQIGEASKYAWSTLLCTRHGDMQDPYYAATQSIVWRMLWSKFASRYPIIVFVCPWTPQQQRDVLAGQGAIIHELEQIDDIVPVKDLEIIRWRDQFSKLNLWNYTQYERIIYMDSDVFPVQNIDDVFDIALQQCDRVKLKRPRKHEEVDLTAEEIEDVCTYSFAAVDWYNSSEINGGFFMLKPNQVMHKRLLTLARRPDFFDHSRMEQGLLSQAFHRDSPFPVHLLDYGVNPNNEWVEDAANYDKIRVIHQKLWVPMIVNKHPLIAHMWDLDWMEMCRFYDSEYFATERVTGVRKSELQHYVEATAN